MGFLRAHPLANTALKPPLECVPSFTLVTSCQSPGVGRRRGVVAAFLPHPLRCLPLFLLPHPSCWHISASLTPARPRSN